MCLVLYGFCNCYILCLFQLKSELICEKKDKFSLENALQSCLVELKVANDNVKEVHSVERVAVRRLTASVEKEKQERKKSSIKYSKEVLDLKRDTEQLMVELQTERIARQKDVKGIGIRYIFLCLLQK